MIHFEIVMKLIGDVRPKGDANRDKQILENLKSLCELHSEIHRVIDDIAYDFRDDKQHSVKLCCEYASKYIDSLGIQ